MRITMDSVTFLQVRKAVSSKGKPFGRIQLLTDSYDVYDIFVPANKVGCLDAITPHTTLSNVPFDLVAGFNGGVQLVPAWDEPVND